MPEEIILEIIGQTIGVAIEFAALFWNEIIVWTGELLTYWANADIIPMAASVVELAFTATSEMTAEMLTAVVSAWEALRSVLLNAVVEIVRSPDVAFEWVQRITTILVAASGDQKEDELQAPIVIEAPNRPIIIRRTTEEAVNWDRLPAEARLSFIQGQQEKYGLDLINTREKELAAMQMNQ